MEWIFIELFNETLRKQQQQFLNFFDFPTQSFLTFSQVKRNISQNKETNSSMSSFSCESTFWHHQNLHKSLSHESSHRMKSEANAKLLHLILTRAKTSTIIWMLYMQKENTATNKCFPFSYVLFLFWWMLFTHDDDFPRSVFRSFWKFFRVKL